MLGSKINPTRGHIQRSQTAAKYARIADIKLIIRYDIKVISSQHLEIHVNLDIADLVNSKVRLISL